MKPVKKKKNIPILSVTWGFIILFLAMSCYITVYSVTHKRVLLDNSYNSRQEILLAKNRRGQILASDGTVLAHTVKNEQGKEVREYPFGNLFSHTVGYAVNGKMGIESIANYELIQSNAPLSEKAKIDIKTDKYPGDDVYTTLNVSLQEVASKALGVYRGAVIVTDPKTGKILAMVSKPDFDPATVAANWDDYIQDKESGVLVNRATQGLYPPGSTFKMITSLEYIKEHPEDYLNYHYQCTGSITKGEDTIQCYHGTVHGSVDFKKSFAKSCNTSFANIGLSLNRDQFGETLNTLLFNQELPVDFSYSKARLSVDSETTDEDMMQISIGQGTASITPLHLNMITCAIANEGKLMKPYLIDSIKNSAGSVMKEYSPTSCGNIMTKQDADILASLMRNVVTEGTASKLDGLTYTAAGKTGSAEYGAIKGESHAWFTGYAPAEDPQICVTIIIEGAGAGGDYAVPIAKRLFDAYLINP